MLESDVLRSTFNVSCVCPLLAFVILHKEGIKKFKYDLSCAKVGDPGYDITDRP